MVAVEGILVIADLAVPRQGSTKPSDRDLGRCDPCDCSAVLVW